MILAPIIDRVKVYGAIIIGATIVCLAGYGLVQSVQPVHAKSEPEPAECSPWATLGAQNVWKCIDPDDDVICYVNNYSFMQCILP